MEMKQATNLRITLTIASFMALILLLKVLSANTVHNCEDPNHQHNNTQTDSTLVVDTISTKVVKVEAKKDSSVQLVEALIQVESRGNASAVGDKHLSTPSIGVLQIRPIMVREVNRILKKLKSNKKYKLEDRFSRKKSIQMFMVWKNYYHKNSSIEKIARCWNGGPLGYKRKATLGYWNKVKNELKG